MTNGYSPRLHYYDHLIPPVRRGEVGLSHVGYERTIDTILKTFSKGERYRGINVFWAIAENAGFVDLVFLYQFLSENWPNVPTLPVIKSSEFELYRLNAPYEQRDWLPQIDDKVGYTYSVVNPDYVPYGAELVTPTPHILKQTGVMTPYFIIDTYHERERLGFYKGLRSLDNEETVIPGNYYD